MIKVALKDLEFFQEVKQAIHDSANHYYLKMNLFSLGLIQMDSK